MRPTAALRALPRFLPRALALGCAALLGACSTTSPTAPAAPTPPVSAAQVGEYRAGSGILKGYLAAGEMPDSLALVAAPPAAGSAAQAADDAATRQLTALAAGPRGALARKDADLHFPAAASVYACALGVRVSEADTPHLNMLLRRTLTDAGLATYKAKNHYQRTRPFVALKLPSCTPDEEAKLAKDGSYPSGHSSLGWAWALVLTEAAPRSHRRAAAARARLCAKPRRLRRALAKRHPGGDAGGRWHGGAPARQRNLPRPAERRARRDHRRTPGRQGARRRTLRGRGRGAGHQQPHCAIRSLFAPDTQLRSIRQKPFALSLSKCMHRAGLRPFDKLRTGQAQPERFLYF